MLLVCTYTVILSTINPCYGILPDMEPPPPLRQNPEQMLIVGPHVWTMKPIGIDPLDMHKKNH